MHRAVDISLSGHAEPFRLHEDAYEALAGYLQRAGARLTDDPDRDEVIGDLELSIGEKLASRLSTGRQVVDLGDVRAILEEVGAVDTETHQSAPLDAGRRRVRRLYRIHQGEKVAGVCQGLATYADLDVEMVRWIVAILTILTGGILGLVYIAAMFILPVVSTREEYFAAMDVQGVTEGAGR